MRLSPNQTERIKSKVTLAWREGELASPVIRYGVTIAATVSALGLRMLMDPWLQNEQPFWTFYVVVIAVALWTGWREASLAAILGFLAGDWFFIPIRGSLQFQGGITEALMHFGAYGTVCGTIIALAAKSKRTHRQFETLFTLSPDLITVAGFDGHFKRLNPAWERTLGYGIEELCLRPWLDFVHPEDRAKTLDAGNKLTSGERVSLFVNRYRCQDGSYRFIEWHCVSVPGEQMIYCVARDITDRKRAEEQLLLQATALESAANAIVITNRDGIIQWVNPAFERLTGYGAGEVIGGTPRILKSGKLSQAFYETLWQTILAGRVWHGDMVNRRKDGILYDEEMTITPVKNAEGEVTRFVAIKQDVTRRKKAEKALRQSEERFRQMANGIPNLAWIAKADGRIEWFNSRWYEYTGTTYREMEGWGWQSVHDPACLPEVLEQWKASIETGHPFEMELPLRGADGHFHPFLTRVTPLKGEDGSVIQWFGTNTDISDVVGAREVLARSREELEKLVNERTAKLTEMVEELEHFSYTITHDMRAPLRAMQGFGTVLADTCSRCVEPFQQDLIRRIVQAAARMDNLITDALDYSTAVRKELPLEIVDAEGLLRGIVETYPQFYSPNAEVEILGEFAPVMANQAGLTQCFSNLLNNAIKFVAPGQTPKVRIWAEKRGLVQRLWFEDNGIGIAGDQQQKIFGMFQRLARDYEGTGIGLALVRKVMERMAGTVGVESEPGKGSRFWLELKTGVPSDGANAEKVHRNEQSA